MFLCMKNLLKIFIWFQLASFSAAQDDEECGVIASNSTNSTLLDLPTGFGAIAPELACAPMQDRQYFAPQVVNWRVFVVADGEPAQYRSTPDNLVKAFVSDAGVLRFGLEDGVPGANVGDSVQAGVEIWIPASQLSKVELKGENELVEIHNIDATNAPAMLEIEDRGDANKLYVDSVSPVTYNATGAGSTLFLKGGEGTRLYLLGSNQIVRATAPEDLWARMNGIDNNLYVRSQFQRITMLGQSSNVWVTADSWGCEELKVVVQGVQNECAQTGVTVDWDLPCLSTSEIEKVACGEADPVSGAVKGAGDTFSIVAMALGSAFVWLGAMIL